MLGRDAKPCLGTVVESNPSQILSSGLSFFEGLTEKSPDCPSEQRKSRKELEFSFDEAALSYSEEEDSFYKLDRSNLISEKSPTSPKA